MPPSEAEYDARVSNVYVEARAHFLSAAYRRYPRTAPRYNSQQANSDEPNHPHRTDNPLTRREESRKTENSRLMQAVLYMTNRRNGKQPVLIGIAI